MGPSADLSSDLAGSGTAGLQARLQLFATALDMSSDVVLMIDAETMAYLGVNKTALAFHGITLEEHLGLKSHELAQPWLSREDLARTYAELVACSPRTLTAIVPVTSRFSGRTATFEMQRQAIRIDGRWVIVARGRDITDAEHREQRLHRFASALDQITDAVFTVDCATAAIIEVNQGACRLLGYPREALIGRSAPAFVDAPAAQLRETYRQVIRQSPAVLTAEIRMIRADGSRVECEAMRQAIRSSDRWVMVLTARDVTERNKAQERLNLFGTALDLGSDIVVLIDRETMTYVGANQAACDFHGVTREELMRIPPYELTAPSLPRAALERLHDELIAQAPKASEGVLPVVSRRTGRTITLKMHRQAIRIGGRWTIVVRGQDLTEIERGQARIHRFLSALNQSPDGIFLVDFDSGLLLDVNEAACRMLGYTREQMMEIAPVSVIDAPEDEILEVYRTARERSPATQTSEMRVIRADGSGISCEVLRQAIQSEGRWVLVVTLRDITEKKAALARQAMLATALDLGSDFALLIDAQTISYVGANKAVCDFHGVTQEELLRIRPEDLNRGRLTREDMRRNYEELIACSPRTVRSTLPTRSISTGREILLDIQRQAIRLDGRWIIVVRGRDITEEERNRARMERFASALDLGDDACFILDRETMRYLDVNEAACRLLGRQREELLSGWPPNRSSPELGSLDDLAAVFDEVIRVSPATVTAHYGVHRADGTVVPCEVRRQARRSGGRWIISAIVRDISERVRAEDEIRQRVTELERSNRELEQFAYVTSHDLSEPLRMVASYTQLLQRRYGAQLDTDAKEFMGFIVDGAQRMKRLIDDLLLYSRAGRGAASHEPLALDEALDDALANLSQAVADAGARIERTPLPVLPAGKSGMVQLFQNLVANAIKFRSAAAPVVSIGAERTRDGWTLRVKDNGIGIEPRYFERIFVIFQRLHARGAYEGTGIGLAICRKVVEQHHGRIEVRSAPGEGATFLVHLPDGAPARERP